MALLQKLTGSQRKRDRGDQPAVFNPNNESEGRSPITLKLGDYALVYDDGKWTTGRQQRSLDPTPLVDLPYSTLFYSLCPLC